MNLPQLRITDRLLMQLIDITKVTGTVKMIFDTCFLLEDDQPEKHGAPIACTQCWNAVNELLEDAQAKLRRVAELINPVIQQNSYGKHGDLLGINEPIAEELAKILESGN